MSRTANAQPLSSSQSRDARGTYSSYPTSRAQKTAKSRLSKGASTRNPSSDSRPKTCKRLQDMGMDLWRTLRAISPKFWLLINPVWPSRRTNSRLTGSREYLTSGMPTIPGRNLRLMQISTNPQSPKSATLDRTPQESTTQNSPDSGTQPPQSSRAPSSTNSRTNPPDPLSSKSASTPETGTAPTSSAASALST